MSTFSCPVVPVRIIPHPNADAIEIAEVGLFQSIVKKGQYQTGEFKKLERAIGRDSNGN